MLLTNIYIRWHFSPFFIDFFSIQKLTETIKMLQKE